MKKYQIIYVDPPWKYNSRANHKTRFRGGCCGHYSLMSYEEIKRLPIPDLADKNCALFLWNTFPYIDKQLELFKYWGFRYRTIAFLWVKLNSKNKKPFFGVGYYTKSNPEPCMLGMKGQLKTKDNSISNLVFSPRREHSRKPDEIREKIVKLFGDLPRIELFARQKTKDWNAIGYDIDGLDINESIGELCKKKISL